MAEVPDHLVPMDGLSNASIRYAGFDAAHDSGDAAHRFDIFDEDDGYVGTFKIETEPNVHNSIDQMVREAHQKMTNVLRQLLWLTNVTYQNRDK